MIDDDELKTALQKAGFHNGPGPYMASGGLEQFKALLSPYEDEIARLNAIINTPQSDDFLRAVSTEAEHQRQRWGSSHDEGKTPEDWLFLIGYLATKAVQAERYGDQSKFEHHLITAAAALKNWHLAAFGKTDMRPGI